MEEELNTADTEMCRAHFADVCLDFAKMLTPFFCFASYREVVSGASKTSNGAHLEDAGVL